MNSFHIPRREFLRQSAIIPAVAALPAWFAGAAPAVSNRRRSANDRPGIALVGCGGMGSVDLESASRFGQVVALCDVDSDRLAKAGAKWPGAKQYRDFRAAIADASVEVVINGTPDHWHTLVNLAALKAGCDVYSEKPLTLTIDEGKRLVAAVKSSGGVLQTGSQQRSNHRFRLACEIVRNGRIGKLRHVATSLPSGRHGGPFAPSEVPPGLDWNLWQGQVAAVPYVKERCHGSFRYWWDYSGGTLTDWGAHHNDIALWGMGMERSGPVEVSAIPLRTPVAGGFSFPSEYRVEYVYANGVVHTCQTVASENPSGGVEAKPTAPGQFSNGVTFTGDDGWVFVSRSKIEASGPDILQEPLTGRTVSLYQSTDHMGNFFDCIRSRKAPICEAEIGHRSVSVCHLGAIALRLGRRLRWDPNREQFVGDREAGKWIARPQRAPFTYAMLG